MRFNANRWPTLQKVAGEFGLPSINEGNDPGSVYLFDGHESLRDRGDVSRPCRSIIRLAAFSEIERSVGVLPRFQTRTAEVLIVGGHGPIRKRARPQR